MKQQTYLKKMYERMGGQYTYAFSESTEIVKNDMSDYTEVNAQVILKVTVQS